MKHALSREAPVPFPSSSSGPREVTQSPVRPSATERRRTRSGQVWKWSAATPAARSSCRGRPRLPGTSERWTPPEDAVRFHRGRTATVARAFHLVVLRDPASSQPACGQMANRARYSTAPPGPLTALIRSSGGSTTSGECTTKKPPALASSGTSVSGTARTPAIDAGTSWSRAASMRRTQPGSTFSEGWRADQERGVAKQFASGPVGHAPSVRFRSWWSR